MLAEYGLSPTTDGGGPLAFYRGCNPNRAVDVLIDGTPARQAAPSLARLRSSRAQLVEVCARYGASGVAVFGSVARGEQDEASDLDLVVDIEDGRSLLDLAGLIGDLEDLLGCPVNIVERALLRDDKFGRAVRRDAVAL